MAFFVLGQLFFKTGFSADEAFFHLYDSAGENRDQSRPAHSFQFRFDNSGSEVTTTGIPAGKPVPESNPANAASSTDFGYWEKTPWERSGDTSDIKRLKRAEMISLSAQILGMGALQAADAWHTRRRPFSDTRDNLRRAWTTAPAWDQDSYFYNYIGHPYTGAFTYNLMRSQKASPVASWLFSCSQSLIWEFALEATEQHPSVQDLLFTSNLGSLMGEGFHRLTGKMRKDGLSWKEKLLILALNPAHLLNNGFR